MLKMMKTLVAVSTFALMTACGGGGGGGGSSSNNIPIFSCSGNGYNYVCVQVASGGGSSSSPTAGPVQPFPIATSISALVTSGLNATGLDIDPYTQAGTFAVTKTPTSVTFNGQSVTQLRTTTTWPSVSQIINTWTGYVAPYDIYFDANKAVYGFHIANLYGLKTSGIANPTSVNDGGSGTLASFNLFSDANLTVAAGTATLAYSVVNCCDKWSNTKATMKLTLTATGTNSANLWTLTQGFVVTTSGGITFAGEDFNSGTDKRIYYPTGGY